MRQAAEMPNSSTGDETTIVKSTCRLCFNGCGVLISIKDGHPTSLTGDPDHPLSKGMICPRGHAALELLDHPHRLRHPIKRTGPRGGGKWERVSWDEALDTIVAELTKIGNRLGPQAVVFMRGGSKGTSDDHLTRLANIFGSPNVSTTSSICYSPCALASKHTYGFMAYPDLKHPPRCIIRWGFNPKVTLPPLHREIVKATSAGTKLVVIDPRVSNDRADLQLQPKPGSDGALALAMAHVIIEEGLYDRAFVERWTVGFRRLRAHLQVHTPEIAQAMTWVPAQKIREAARMYATVRPGCILWGNALESGPNNYQTCRAICILRALTGNLGAAGSDVMWSDLGELQRRSPLFTRPELLPPDMAAQRLGAHAKLLPDFAYAPHNLVAKAILDGKPYPIRGAYLQGGNLLCTSADSQLMSKALTKLDFIAATDHFMTPTTALADIVLPASTYLEHNSVEQPWHFPVASIQQQVADPGETRSEGQICNDLARRIGHGEYAFEDMDEFLEFYLHPAGMSFDQFRSQGTIAGPKQLLAHEEHGFPTPSGLVELYSAPLGELGLPPLPEYREFNLTDDQFPLIMTSQKSPQFYHSCGRQLPSLRRSKPEPSMRLHPETAQSLGLNDGTMALLTTATGSIRQCVRLDESLTPGVVMADYGWWFPEQGAAQEFGWRQANLNVLTSAPEPCSSELGSAALRGIPCRIEPMEEQS
ncbi:molybdopterin-containing oxidoreductase family protein [Desulfovibrio ferrophilus]|uniref:Molybdopterin oxidoreductase n=1 Tax=Desulfovibrio ferrophilus TaxID=241368 RepID=A0A2Z6B1A8_9BACT|nr:molybdopterin-dependent oxidoreductase [Desulfovibrio ferrophilus]BBD09243.1 molybdopterin oxidoreductase [Desulfovibrio ferrophilus]